MTAPSISAPSNTLVRYLKDLEFGNWNTSLASQTQRALTEIGLATHKLVQYANQFPGVNIKTTQPMTANDVVNLVGNSSPSTAVQRALQELQSEMNDLDKLNAEATTKLERW